MFGHVSERVCFIMLLERISVSFCTVREVYSF